MGPTATMISPGFFLCRGDYVLDGFQIGVGAAEHDDRGIAVQDRHRLEIPDQVRRAFSIRHAHGGDLAEQRAQQRVAVFARPGDFLRGDGAGAGRLIDDGDLHLGGLAQFFADEAK